MCTELILSFLYFFIIFVINSFLFQFLQTGLKKILFFIKIKNTLNLYKVSEFSTINFPLLLFFIFAKKSNFWNYFFSSLDKRNCTNDLLVIGNVYKYLYSSRVPKNNEKSHFFELVEKQYLFIDNKK